jgi:hypothetical protein
MKKLCHIVFLFLFLFSYSNVYSGEIFYDTAGSFEVRDQSYVNNMNEVWIINTGTAKPVVFQYWMSIENTYDFIYIYALDAYDNELLISTLTGQTGSGDNIVSTNLPTGRAKVVFKSDGSNSGLNGYWGFTMMFYSDETFSSQVYDNLFVNNQSFVNGNSIVSNKLSVGKSNPTRRMEIWDGLAGYTFSANNSTSGYEVNHTLDDTGYKVNISSASRNYKISIGGSDKLKILSNNNYAIGGGLNNVSSGGYNIALGAYSSMGNTIGSNNIAIGTYSLFYNTGSYNIATGYYALRGNTTGAYNIGIGYNALYGNTDGTYNVGLGYNAGRYISQTNVANKLATNSIFIGRDSKAQLDGQTNQIVIGYNAVGNGSNTVTIGGDEITKTILKGYVGIGTNSPDHLLTVKGVIHAEGVLVDLQVPFPDYVFNENYVLKPLSEVENFISLNKHLPDIPSANDIKKNGLNIGEIQTKLLQKIEELTLYVIEQERRIESQKLKIDDLQKELKLLK